MSAVDFLAIDENLRESFRILAANRPGGEIRGFPGIFIANAGVSFQMFNAAFLCAPVADEKELARRVAMAATFFQARGTRWAFWLCAGWLAPAVARRARGVFERHGLRHVSAMPGMVAERIVEPAAALPALEVRRVADGDLRQVFCDIGSVCFHVPLTWFKEVFDNDRIWSDFAGYIGYVNGEPVSTAAVVATPAALGVYNVATLPARQRRGYGEAIVRHALERSFAEHGRRPTILQSTPQGLSLYERMGYSTRTAVMVYAS